MIAPETSLEHIHFEELGSKRTRNGKSFQRTSWSTYRDRGACRKL